MSGLSSKWGRLLLNGTNPGLFQLRFQYILARNETWCEKSPGCVQFVSNLSDYIATADSPAPPTHQTLTTSIRQTGSLTQPALSRPSFIQMVKNLTFFLTISCVEFYWQIHWLHKLPADLACFISWPGKGVTRWSTGRYRWYLMISICYRYLMISISNDIVLPTR